MARLSPPGIQDAYARLSAQGLSDYSVLQVHRTLHRALDRAFRWGLIARNPASLVVTGNHDKDPALKVMHLAD